MVLNAQMNTCNWLPYYEFYNAGAEPNDTSQLCYPKCKPGQCCVNGICLCFDSNATKVLNCKGLLYSYTVISTYTYCLCYLIVNSVKF